MSRRGPRRAAVLCGILAGGLGGLNGAAARAPRPPSRLLVYAQEWRMWPSRSTVPAGTIVVQLWNRGQDPHDLRVEAGGATAGVALTPSGGFGRAVWRLNPGRYVLYCSLPAHRKLGMHTSIVVLKR